MVHFKKYDSYFRKKSKFKFIFLQIRESADGPNLKLPPSVIVLPGGPNVVTLLFIMLYDDIIKNKNRFERTLPVPILVKCLLATAWNNPTPF